MASKQRRREDQAEGVRDSYAWLRTKRDMKKVVAPALATGVMGRYNSVVIHHDEPRVFVRREDNPPPLPSSKFIQPIAKPNRWISIEEARAMYPDVPRETVDATYGLAGDRDEFVREIEIKRIEPGEFHADALDAITSHLEIPPAMMVSDNFGGRDAIEAVYGEARKGEKTSNSFRRFIIGNEASGLVFGENGSGKWTWHEDLSWPPYFTAPNYSLHRERRATKRTNRARGRRWRFGKSRTDDPAR